MIYTKVEVFVDKKVRRHAWTERGNTRGAKKKREISRTLLSINIHFSVDVDVAHCHRLTRKVILDMSFS